MHKAFFTAAIAMVMALSMVSDADAGLKWNKNQNKCVGLNVSNPLSEPVPLGVDVTVQNCASSNPAQALKMTSIRVGDGDGPATYYLQSRLMSEGAMLCLDTGHKGPNPNPGDEIEADGCNFTPYQLFNTQFNGADGTVKFISVQNTDLCLDVDNSNKIVVATCDAKNPTQLFILD